MGSTLMAAILLGLGWSSMGGKPARRRPSRTGYTAPSGSDVVGDVVDVYGDVVDVYGDVVDTVAETVVNTGKTIIDWFEDTVDWFEDTVDDIIDPYVLNVPDPYDLPGPTQDGDPITVVDPDPPYVPPSDVPLTTLYYPFNQGYDAVDDFIGPPEPFNAHDYIGVQGGDDRSGTVDYSQESLLDYAWRAGTDWFTNLRGLW